MQTSNTPPQAHTPTHRVQIELVQYETLQKEFETLKTSYSDVLNKLDQVLAKMQTPKQETELISREDVCKLLNISLSTLHIWRKQGILKDYRIGNKVRFKKAEVLEAITEIKPRTQD